MNTKKEESYIGYCPHGAPDGECPVIDCANHKEEGEKTNYYDRFVRQGIAIGFTDDQVDFLADWMDIKDGTEITSPTEEKKGEATGEWEKDFDERFGGEGVIAKTDENLILIGFTKKEVKDFIRSTLSTTEQAVREALAEEVRGFQGDLFTATEDYLFGFMECKAKVLSALSPQEHTS